MEKKKIDLGTAAVSAGKAASSLFGKAKNAVVSTIDQNNDGKLDYGDVSMITDSVKKAVKNSNEKRMEIQEKQRKERELKQLCPLFEDDLDTADFSLPKLIRVAEMDKKHKESEVCVGSVGFESVQKELKVLQIYPEKLDLFGLSFYPDQNSDLYYADPCDRDFYIALDDYFSYMKIARISELQKIAQDLGAKHFKVTYKEQKKSSSSKAISLASDLRTLGRQGGAAHGNYSSEESGFEKVDIAAEMQFLGHQPKKPELRYFKKDPQIQNLIELRLSDNPMTHQVYTLKLSSTSGMKVSEALKIDAALSSMKLNANATMTSKAENEENSIFMYEIDF